MRDFFKVNKRILRTTLLICLVSVMLTFLVGCDDADTSDTSSTDVSSVETSSSITSSEEIVEPIVKMEYTQIIATIKEENSYINETKEDSNEIDDAIINSMYFLIRFMDLDYNDNSIEDEIIYDIVKKSDEFTEKALNIETVEIIGQLAMPAEANYLRIDKDDAFVPAESTFGNVWRDAIFYQDVNDASLLHVLIQSATDDNKWSHIQFSDYGYWFESELQLYLNRTLTQTDYPSISIDDTEFVFTTKKDHGVYVLCNELLDNFLTNSLLQLAYDDTIENIARDLTDTEKTNLINTENFISSILNETSIEQYRNGDLEEVAEENYLFLKFKSTEKTKNYAQYLAAWPTGENSQDLCIAVFDDVSGVEIKVIENFNYWFYSKLNFCYRAF